MLGPEWCRAHLSFFADDVHGHWVIRTCLQFHEARLRTLTLIEALHQSDMKVNLTSRLRSFYFGARRLLAQTEVREVE